VQYTDYTFAGNDYQPEEAMRIGLNYLPVAGGKRPQAGSRTGMALLLLAFLTACATTLPVRTDYDRQADFSRYHTFAWVSDNPLLVPVGASPEISPMTRQHILNAIETALKSKGYTMAADRKDADFTVAFTVGTRDRIDIDSYPVAYRGGWYWRHSFWYYEVRTWTYQEGTLAIDIFDQASHQPIWHGHTSKRITESDRANPVPIINEAVNAILAKFPPKKYRG